MTVLAILEGVPLPILVIDAEHRITMANIPATEMFGRDVTGVNANLLLRQPPVLAAMEACLTQGQVETSRFLLSGAMGEVNYSFQAHPLENGGAVLSFEDHSLRDQKETMHRDFVSNISHELRTPLTGLMGFIETLRGPARGDVEAQDRFLAIMEQEAQRMSRMVSDLLSLSRVEIDERVRPRNLVDLAAVLRSALATLEGKLAEAQVVIEATGFSKGRMILGDRDQLTQLFLNLIENALKYGGSSKTIYVEISAIKRDPTLRQAALRVDVRDEGEGINAIHLPRLTERFYRVDDHRSRDQGGTGLGLAIVKHIVNRHRGRLKIQSTQGVGSCFSVIFPNGEQINL